MSFHKNLSFGKTILRASRSYTTPLTTCTNNSKINGRQMSTALDLSGIYPPIPTPFENNENIDWESLKSNLRKWDNFPFKGREIFYKVYGFRPLRTLFSTDTVLAVFSGNMLSVINDKS